MSRVLVAGIGNIFLGDDGFGPEVVRRLAEEGAPPDGVRVVDYGIRGMHLAYDLLEDWDMVLLVDALPDRGAPGDLEVLRLTGDHSRETRLDSHAMDPAAVIASLAALGGQLPLTFLVGAQLHDVEERIGLSTAATAVVAPAVAALQELLRRGPQLIAEATNTEKVG